MHIKPIKKIAHIGIAVKEISKALSFYTEVLGLTLEHISEVKSEGVKIAFLKIGETRFELLEPLHKRLPVYAFIEKKGEGIHHIALETDDIGERLEYMKQAGIRLINQQPKKGAHDSTVAFLHPKSTHGVLFELCQYKKGEDT